MKTIYFALLAVGFFIQTHDASALKIKITRSGSDDGVHYNYVSESFTSGFFGKVLELNCQKPGHALCEFSFNYFLNSSLGPVNPQDITIWVDRNQIAEGNFVGKAYFSGDIFVTWKYNAEFNETEIEMYDHESDPLVD